MSSWTDCLLPTKKAGLIELLNSIPVEFFPDGRATKEPKTNKARAELVRAARRNHWSKQRRKRRGLTRPSSLCEIPASEVNEWLKTLPPIIAPTAPR